MDTRSLASQIAMRAPTDTIELSDAVPSLPRTASDILRARAERPVPKTTEQIASDITQMVESPERLQSMLDALGDGLDEHAPEAAQDLRMAASRAMFFLASKAPRPPPPVPGFDTPPTPSDQLRRFERYLKAVNDPTTVLDDAMSGALTPESLEAVKHVYPKTFLMMQSDIASLLDHSAKVPYSRRMQLSALLGQDMTGTLRPAVSLSAQSAYQSQGPQSDASRQMPVSRADKLNMADRAEYNTVARKEAQRGVGMWNKRG